MTAYTQTPRTRLRRRHHRGAHDRASEHAILDAGLMCHVGYVVDGFPHVTPTLYWRSGERVYWHGSSASRMLRLQGSGVEVCLAVSHLDGLVLARSGFHHSANYRSVMLFGRARKIEDGHEVARRLEVFMERLAPGRWAELRPITARELKATTLLEMEIDQVSAKIRTGGPLDDEEDYAHAVWAGVLPVTTHVGAAESDPRLDPAIAVPESLGRFRLG